MTSPIAFVAQPPPLVLDEDGVLRVGGTRVRLETVINAFQVGCAAEEILLKYPSLHLTDIYAVITYDLWHRAEVDVYLAERRHLADTVRQENETRFSPASIREHLLARRAPQQ